MQSARRLIGVLVPLVMFGVAALFVISASDWFWAPNVTREVRQMSGADKSARPSASGETRSGERPLGPADIEKILRNERDEQRRIVTRKPTASDGTLVHLRYWVNTALALEVLSDSAKRTLSLIFSALGTVFAFRTYLLNRRRTRLLEESVARLEQRGG